MPLWVANDFSKIIVHIEKLRESGDKAIINTLIKAKN